MKTLSIENKTIMRIQSLLNDYLNSVNTQVEINAVELYDVIRKDLELKKRFRTGFVFNRFLRRCHKKGDMKSLLNYRVDDTDHKRYLWFFRSKNTSIESKSINTTINKGLFNYYKSSKNVIASDGTKLSSLQEIVIYENLVKESHLIIEVDGVVRRDGEHKHPDFIIKNKLTGKQYYWEHLGMTNDEVYRTKMVDKIEWYKNNGFKTIEKGGNLIYTYYTNTNNLIKDVKKIIQIIKK